MQKFHSLIKYYLGTCCGKNHFIVFNEEHLIKYLGTKTLFSFIDFPHIQDFYKSLENKTSAK